MADDKAAWVIDVTEADFEAQVLDRSREVPVVVDFWAPWCGPCRTLGPLLEKLAREKAGEFVLAKVNTDDSPQLAAAFRIESIPAVKAIRDGQIVLEFEGVLPEAALRDFVERLRPSEAERLSREAAGLEGTDPAKAEALYRQAVAAERPPEAALVGLARVLLAGGKAEEVEALLRRVGPGGEQAAEVDRLSAMLALRQEKGAPGEEAKLRQKLAKDPENAGVRYELGCALAAAGKYEEALGMLLSAAERDKELAKDKVREAMVQVFQVVGVRSELAETYRDKLRALLY